MVFGAIRRFDNAFLLLEFFLDPPSLGHASRERHCRNGEHCCPRLHSKKRLIFILSSERSKTAHCSPHCYYGKNENTGSSFALSEAECGPNHNRSADKSD